MFHALTDIQRQRALEEISMGQGDWVSSPSRELEDDDVVLSWWPGARSWDRGQVLLGWVHVTRTRESGRYRGQPAEVRVDWADGESNVYDTHGGGVMTRHRRRGEILNWERDFCAGVRHGLEAAGLL